MTILLLILSGLFIGLLAATFLLITGWFAWTPLPLIVRVPLAIVLISPFGLIGGAIMDERALAMSVAALLWVCVVTGFAADRSPAFTYCVVVLLLFCVAPLLLSLYFNPAMTDQVRYSVFGFIIVLMLSLSLFSLPLRLLGFRLERLAVDADDFRMRLASEKSVDEWIFEFQKTGNEDASFAEIASMVRQRGITAETAHGVAKVVCRSLGKPSPRMAKASDDGGLSSWLQWATTGPRRDQFSMRQLLMWVAASSILFAVLARTGIDRDLLLLWFALLPSMITTSTAVSLLGWGWLAGRPGERRFLLVSGGCFCLGLAGLMFQYIPFFGGGLLRLPPAFSAGSMIALNYWLMHLRREGFRLIRT